MEVPMGDGRKKKGRLIIVSNRLPFSVKVQEQKLEFSSSAGGLVTGLEAYLDSTKDDAGNEIEYTWVGWPGATVPQELRNDVIGKAQQEFNSYPVFLTQEEMDEFYLGFCNKTIWPLFHYFPSYTRYDEQYWRTYRHVNEIFRDALLEIVEDGDLLWIHDYHLMLLPGMMRSLKPGIRCGFFLHIPFPSFEVYRLLPVRWRQELLDGLLGADLIGFHTHDYRQHFLQSVLRILGYKHQFGRITLEDRVVEVEAFPMGIDYEKFENAVSSDEVNNERLRLRDLLGQRRVIISVDRLDYSKGIINRLEGFEKLLEDHPRVHEQVLLLMIVVPSRVEVEQYDLMKRQIEEMVGRINGRFGTLSWTPIVYQFRSMPFPALVAHYSLADIALVTPLRDGMNLVAKEYIATRTDQSGVLILSEMAGTAKELGEAMIINPNTREEIAEALWEALNMPLEEQQRRNRSIQRRLRRYNVQRWANDFVEHLSRMGGVQERFLMKLLTPEQFAELKSAYVRASSRLLLIDYDGTLVPFVKDPSKADPPEDVLSLLRSLADDQANTLVMVSGRDRISLEKWLGGLPVNFVAEHGVWLKHKDKQWHLIRQLQNEWKDHIRPILELYADRLPGSLVEEKDYSLVWHFRGADYELGTQIAGELKDQLLSFTANNDLQVLQGNRVIEIKPSGINKGVATQQWLQSNPEFILALGDDWTDEDTFAVLPESAFSVKVGISSTNARNNVRDYKDVRLLLRLLAESTRREMTHG